jgi:hypothetical protein
MIMSIFTKLLAETIDKELEAMTPEGTADASTFEDTFNTDEEVVAPEEEPAPEEEAEPTEEGLSQIKQDTQELIMTVLDAIEQDELAQGSEITDDEAVDIGLELIYKLIPKLSDEDVQIIHDELSEYFDIEVNSDAEGEGEDEEYFEEPKAENETDYEEDVKSESVKKKSRI